MDRTLNQTNNRFCFLEHPDCVKGDEEAHLRIVETDMKSQDDENQPFELSNCDKIQLDRANNRLLGWNKKIKTEAIRKINPPKTLRLLQSFLCKTNHIAKFQSNAAKLTDGLSP